MVWVRTDRQVEAALRTHPGVQRVCERVADAVAHEARAIEASHGPVSGQYVESVRAVRAPTGWRARAGAPYSSVIEGGSGIYGPTKTVVRAKAGRMMVFRTKYPPTGGRGGAPPGVERKLGLMEHRGMPGRHPMSKAAAIVAASSGRLRYRSKGRRWVTVE